MINEETMIEAVHFVMLDDVNTVSGNEFDRSYPKVQIIYPLGMNNTDNKVIESHPKNGLNHKEKRKYFSTITLNLDTD